MVPGLLKSLPKSGGWLDSVKVVMGFLELAAALKFFRTAELRSPFGVSYFTYDVVLAGWVAISFACGLYLLNAYRLPHDEEKPNIGVMRLMFAVLFLGLSVYLLPGIFKGPDGTVQRPKGAVFAWVDAFLLPEPKPKATFQEDDKHLIWGSDLKDALDRVRANAQMRTSHGRRSTCVLPPPTGLPAHRWMSAAACGWIEVAELAQDRLHDGKILRTRSAQFFGSSIFFAVGNPR